MAEPHKMTKVIAHAASIAFTALAAAYDKNEDVTRPKGDQLVSTVSTIMIALKDKTNLLHVDEDHLKRCAWVLAQMYVDQHRQVLKAFEGNNEIRDERMMSLVTTCFIQSSREIRMPERKRSRQ